MKRLLTSTILAVSLSGTAFGSNFNENDDNFNWKEGHQQCTGTSPFIEKLVDVDLETTRPILSLGEGLQVWIAEHNGAMQTIITTEGGSTIVGTIYGPQGENISNALLSLTPNPDFKPIKQAKKPVHERSYGSKRQSVVNASDLASRITQFKDVSALSTGTREQRTKEIEPTDKRQAAPSNLPARQKKAVSYHQDVQPRSVATAVTPPPPASAFSSSRHDGSAPEVRSTNEQQTASLTAEPVSDPAVKEGLELLWHQAENERLWFSAHEPKESAKVVYMLTDPECPHCQATIDRMYNDIRSGDVDLRIIPTPILGVESFQVAGSIIHAENISQTFMDHMTNQWRGTPAVARMPLKELDKNVVQGIVDNINWMRTNQIRSVPFFLYKDQSGDVTFTAGQLPERVYKTAQVR